MKILSRYFFILICISALSYSAKAQDTILVSGTQYVKKGQTLTITAGKLLLFEPGATLQVEGGLKLNGIEGKSIIVRSMNPVKPGVGILFSGIDEDASINISHVSFEGMLQPLHFDPFWYRKEVNIGHCNLSGSTSGEPVLYVSKPLLDIRGGRDVLFNLNEIRVFNNSGNFLLEGIGSDGIIYTLNNLLFYENNIENGNGTLGMLHLECSTPVNNNKVKIERLAFVRNFAGKNPVGLSVGGSLDSIIVSELSQDLGEKRLVYDRQVNNRIPKVEVKLTTDIGNWEFGKNIVTKVNHYPGEIVLKVIGDPKIKELQDSLKQPVTAVLIHHGDSIFVSYTEGDPKYVILADGVEIIVPAQIQTEHLAANTIKRKELGQTKPVWPDSTQLADNSLISLKFKLPTFGGKHKKLTHLKFWEAGAWFGGGIYCGGDYKHRYGPFFPSTIEYSGGVYGQYNVNDRFSIKTSFYLTTISMHNPWAPGQFSRMASVFSIDKNYEPIEIGNSYEHMFATKMQILELEGLWHIRSYMLAPHKKAKLVPSIGFGAGVFHFTPYRYAWDPRQPNESFHDWKNRIYTHNQVNLREVGSEGQNFLPGAKRYSSVAYNIGCSFSLTLLFNKWAIKGEAKAILTSTDYLDDYGPGLWYGGDYKKMIASAKQTTNYSDKILAQTLPYDPKIAPNAPRSTNGLTDAYFQVHLGVSYFLNRKRGKSSDKK